MKKIIRVIAPIAGSLVLSLLSPNPGSAQIKAEVTVDYSVHKGRQKSMLGMNHGAFPTPEEVDRTIPAFNEFIAPLDFHLWSEGSNMTRVGFLGMVEETHPKTRSFLRLGAGLVKRCPYDGPAARPYEQPNKYKEYLRCAVAWARDRDVAVLDVWNEPNLSSFAIPDDDPRRKRDVFFETFKMAHETILEVWPDAVIAGPSLGKIDQESWLRDFMDYCERERLEVPILTWHEIGTRVDADTFAALEGKIRRARRDYINGPDYPHVGVQEIVINEFVAAKYHDIPASNLALLYYLEEGGADAAARTCWKQVPGSTCFEWTLNGLVTPPDEEGRQSKRALWWVMRYYDKSLGNRAEFQSDFPHLIGMANDDQLLFGLYEDPEFTEETGQSRLTVDVNLENLDQVPWITEDVGSIEIKKREILYKNPEKAVNRVRVKSTEVVKVRTAADGSRRASFKSKMDVHSVLVFELGPVGGPAVADGRKGVVRASGKAAAAKRKPAPKAAEPSPADLSRAEAERAIEEKTLDRFSHREQEDRD